VHERHHEGREPRRSRGTEPQHGAIETRKPTQVGVADERREPAGGTVDDRETTDLVGQPNGEVRGRGVRHERREPTPTTAGGPPTRGIARSRLVDEPTSEFDRNGDTPFVVDRHEIVAVTRPFTAGFRRLEGSF
jgi:hypothetical protein